MDTYYCYLDDVALAIAIALALGWPWNNQEKETPERGGGRRGQCRYAHSTATLQEQLVHESYDYRDGYDCWKPLRKHNKTDLRYRLDVNDNQAPTHFELRGSLDGLWPGVNSGSLRLL